MSQLIQEATRVTMRSSTLIDHIVTSTPENVSASGVVHTGIRDHSLVLAIRKTFVVRKTENTVEIRNMKKFDAQKFVADLSQQHCENFIFLLKLLMLSRKYGRNFS